MKIVQQQTQTVTSVEEAEDMIAGWKRIPGFVYAYAVASGEKNAVVPDKLIGLFEVNGEPRFGAGQRVAYVES